ncbi:MAG: RNA 2',3'-cyclic phosphodiesterase [Clostridiaceae bacterium]|jgi:2'-5' RNA ligase|nr:RNA 2',3'-cyclic phosphodiesterase [Clostridiaceae bacterium]
MRLFYAIEFNESIKEELVKVQSELKRKAKKANFTRKDNLHLTLRFIGDIKGADFPVLTKIQSAVAYENEPFLLKLSEPGIFKRGNKFIVWWGIHESDQLIKLQGKLEEEIRLNGFPAEYKPYRPHITLAREFTSDENIRDIIREFEPITSTFEVNFISLMESLRTDGRLTYICRNKTRLGKAL